MQLQPIANSIGMAPDRMPMGATSGDNVAMGATGSHMTADASALDLSIEQMGISMK